MQWYCVMFTNALTTEKSFNNGTMARLRSSHNRLYLGDGLYCSVNEACIGMKES